MNQDQVEQEIVIDAPVERVWAVLTEPEHVGRWFGDGTPAPVDLRPGGIIRLDHGDHGTFPTKIVAVDPPRALSYRWASGFPGVVADEDNSTLVEFTLSAEGGGTRLKVVESGFTTRAPSPSPSPDDTRESHEQGWTAVIAKLGELSEKLAV
ncbi:SRPBCC family protein [Amycolatopsis sp. NBC_01307]|uniref:SRPBCC family protein n=1 Tax=Amycolatopsis sp. NBC_01307 TaxID=2903561 RepID=UPI002E1470A1|nr:SRPBCC family protein [Amycolatopsis sp. NBC_01307]